VSEKKDLEINEYATEDLEPRDIKNLFRVLQIAGGGSKWEQSNFSYY
jgi:hypothetical protein